MIRCPNCHPESTLSQTSNRFIDSAILACLHILGEQLSMVVLLGFALRKFQFLVIGHLVVATGIYAVLTKKYLYEAEMRSLNETVTIYLDYAERQARRGDIMYMKDWAQRLDAFFQLGEEEILRDKGCVTATIAKALAEGVLNHSEPDISEQL